MLALIELGSIGLVERDVDRLRGLVGARLAADGVEVDRASAPLARRRRDGGDLGRMQVHVL